MGGTRTPALERERIDRIRARVMADVETDARRRRRRRTVLGGVVAASLIVLAGTAGVGIGARSLGGSADGAGSRSEIVAGSTVEHDDGLQDAKTTDGTASSVMRASVVTTGSISVRVDGVERAVEAVRAFVTARGGRVDAESVEQGSAAYADLTVRVPAAGIGGLRTVLEDQGSVRSMTVQREDISAAVADVDARVVSLETSIRRLRQIVDDAGTTADLLAAEKQLTDRQAQLEALQARQRVQTDRTSLATIEVSLYVKSDPGDEGPSGFRGGLADGWRTLVAATGAAVTAAGFLVPWLVPLAVLAGAVVFVRRRRPRG